MSVRGSGNVGGIGRFGGPARGGPAGDDWAPGGDYLPYPAPPHRPSGLPLPVGPSSVGPRHLSGAGEGRGGSQYEDRGASAWGRRGVGQLPRVPTPDDLVQELERQQVELADAVSFVQAGFRPENVETGARWPQCLTPEEAQVFRGSGLTDLGQMVRLKLAGVGVDGLANNPEGEIKPLMTAAELKKRAGTPAWNIRLFIFFGPIIRRRSVDYRAVLQGLDACSNRSLISLRDGGTALRTLDEQLGGLGELSAAIKRYLTNPKNKGRPGVRELGTDVARQIFMLRALRQELVGPPLGEWPAGMSLDEVVKLRRSGLSLPMAGVVQRLKTLPAGTNPFEPADQHVFDLCGIMAQLGAGNMAGLSSVQVAALTRLRQLEGVKSVSR